MNRILIAALALLMGVTTFAADSILRIDVDGVSGQIVPNVKKDNDYNIFPGGWLKEKAKFFQCVVFKKRLTPGGEWKEYDFEFTPDKSGNVTISIKGDWAQKVENRQWVLVSDIKFEIEGVKNSEKPLLGWQLTGKSVSLPKAGAKMTPAYLVNHDNSVYKIMKVEAGKTYEIEVKGLFGKFCG